MTLKPYGRLTLVASLVTLGLVGCGTEEPDGLAAEGDAVETVQSALFPRNCVNVIQKHDGAALGYSNSNEQVFTDPSGGPPNTRFAWCMTPGDAVFNRSHFSPYDQQNTRKLDAYETTNDHRVVLRAFQVDPSQTWEKIDDPFSDAILIKQLSTGRYLDAYTSGTRFAVTRPLQLLFDNTQRWYIKNANCTCDPL